jgi:hypothetical protein
MKVIDISEAETHLSLLFRLAVIESERPRRSLGWAKGQVMMALDFDAPLGDFEDPDTGTS